MDSTQDSLFGKTCRGRLVAEEDEIFSQSSKRLPPLPNPPYQSLNLKETARPITLFGLAQEASWETVGASLGEHWMRNTGECHSVVKESTLSQILEANAPPTYFLSDTACAGILRRAEKRGKELPKMLLDALTEVLECSTSVAKCIDTTFPDPSKNQGGIAIVQPVQEKTLVFNETQITSKKNGNNPQWNDPCHTLAATDRPPTIIALQANGIDRADTAGCNGAGWREDQSYTLNTVDRHAVCYQENIGSICARDYKGVGSQYVEESKLILEKTTYPDICGTLAGCGVGSSRTAGQGNEADFCIASKSESSRRFIVRRLMPIETTRLQGYPKIVEVDMKSATADEVAIIAIREGFISVFPETGEVYATRGPGGIRRKEPLLLRGTIMNGYVVYKLHAAGAKKMVRANRLVWIAENGAIPRGMCVDHINSNKTDNRIANLQLLTPIENSKKAHADGLYKTGDFAGATKIKEHDKRVLSFIYWHYKIPYTRIAPMFGIKRSRAQQIIHEYTWHELAPFDGDVEFWESVRKTWARINETEYKPFKTVERLEKWYYKLRNDGAEYKADGNSLAIPCAEYVIRRIAEMVASEA